MPEQKKIDMRRRKKEYSFEEDTEIVARTIVNVVASTRADVDPAPFVAALLEGYAERIRTVHSAATTEIPILAPAIPDPDSDRPVRTLRVRRYE